MPLRGGGIVERMPVLPAVAWSAPYAADAAVLDAIADARARLDRVDVELAALRRRAADLALETAWRARAADRYRDALARWQESMAQVAERAASLDDELRHVALIVTARADAP